MFSFAQNVIKKTVNVVKDAHKQFKLSEQEAASDYYRYYAKAKPQDVRLTIYGIVDVLPADRAIGVDYEDYEDPPNPAKGSLPCAPHFQSIDSVLARLRPPAWHQFSITEAERSVVVVEDPTMSFCEARRSCQLEVVFQPLASVGKALEEELTHRVIVPLPATIVHKIVFLACGKSDVLPP